MFVIGLFVGMILEFVSWYFIAPLIEKRKRNNPLPYLPYDKACRESCDAYKTCYEVNQVLRSNDPSGEKKTLEN